MGHRHAASPNTILACTERFVGAESGWPVPAITNVGHAQEAEFAKSTLAVGAADEISSLRHFKFQESFSSIDQNWRTR